MRHVLVETNWVFWFAAPLHRRRPDAVRLLDRAAAGEVRLYLPSICLTEARATLLRRFKDRSECQDAHTIRRYLKWAKAEGRVTEEEDGTVRRVLDRFDSWVHGEAVRLDATLDTTMAELRDHPGVDVFALDDAILERAIEIGAGQLALEPYDQAVLAAVLVRGAQLRRDGATDVVFCELDGDLQPWNRRGEAKQPLTGLYDAAGVWVHGDFELDEPPPDWWLAQHR